MIRYLLISLLLVTGAHTAEAEAPTIRNVRHEPGSHELGGGGAKVFFDLSAAAAVALRIYDGRGFVVRKVTSELFLSPGSHELVWDGRDERGRPVPSEAYHYTLEARPEFGQRVLWDLTDKTGGQTLDLDAPFWDAAAQTLHYRLPQPARVRIRVGLDSDGPLLATPVNWLPRSGGGQAERWDGKDTGGVLDLSAHPRLSFAISAFALPRNTLLVGRPDRVALINDLPPETERRVGQHDGRPRLFDWARQSIEDRRDFPVRLVLPDGIERDESGLPLVDAPVRVRIEAAPDDARLLLEERFEAVFFLDGRFLWENETSFFPVAWNWDPRGVNPGIHYLTTNLRGYAGHFGIDTLKVRVKRGTTPADQSR